MQRLLIRDAQPCQEDTVKRKTVVVKLRKGVKALLFVPEANEELNLNMVFLYYLLDPESLFTFLIEG